jgi:hypothetical protein
MTFELYSAFKKQKSPTTRRYIVIINVITLQWNLREKDMVMSSQLKTIDTKEKCKWRSNKFRMSFFRFSELEKDPLQDWKPISHFYFCFFYF